MKARKSRATLCIARSMSLGNPEPSNGTAIGSSRTHGWSITWCAARRMATRRAVLLARPVCIRASVNYDKTAPGEPRAAYHVPHELDWMGTALRGLCRRHRPAGQGRRGACGLEPGHGPAHDRGAGLCLGHRADAGQARRDALARPPHLPVSGALRAGHRPVVAVLLPRPATGAGLARGAAGQAERAAGDGLRLAAAG